MRAVVQRVRYASVKVAQEIHGKIEDGLLILLGVGGDDSEKDAEFLADKIANLRIFSDSVGKMNLSLKDIAGEALVVSQFTLFGDCTRGGNPSFAKAATPEDAERLYQYFVDCLKAAGVPTETGVFQADMKVELLNDGPVTLMLDSKGEF